MNTPEWCTNHVVKTLGKQDYINKVLFYFVESVTYVLHTARISSVFADIEHLFVPNRCLI